MTDHIPTIAEVRELIANRPRSIELEHVAKAADCSVSWVKQFVAGKIPEPGFKKVTAIYKFLSNVH